jgi:hypothetical protein
MGAGRGDAEGLLRTDQHFAFEAATDEINGKGRKSGEVGESAVFDLTVLAVGFAEQHGGVSLTLIRAVEDLDENGLENLLVVNIVWALKTVLTDHTCPSMRRTE